MSHTCVVQTPRAGTVVCVADEPLTLTALADAAEFPYGQFSRLVEEGAILAPRASKGRRRAIPSKEAQRVLLVVRRARELDIPPTVLFRALHDGRATILPDGRILLGTHDPTGELVA